MDRETGSLSLSEIEAGLERLMPRGLTDSAREDLESVVDELAAEASVIPFWRRATVWQSAAAVLLTAALGGALFVKQSQPAGNLPVLAQLEPLVEDSGIAVLEKMSWIEGGADFGVQAINDEGEVSQVWGYNGVEEERVMHVKSGYEVILQRPFEAELYDISSLL